jgi:Ca-activated chloride channel family protein
MKKIFLAATLSAVLASQAHARETLRLKLEPDRDYLLKHSPQELVVKIDLSAIAERPHFKRAPLNLAVVLDRSGSMTGAKIEKARQAAMGLVDQLAPGDVFSLVTYSDHAQVVVSAEEVKDKELLKARIARIRPGGSTALYAGVALGADQLQERFSSRRINRVILLSDGLANVGPSSPRDLRLLGRRLSEQGIAVTTIGVGDDYNEDLMAGLAEASDANYYYVKDTEKLPEIFARELGELMTVAARSIKIEIICPKGIRPLGLIGRPERFEGQKAALQLSQFSLGQERYVFLRCKVDDPTPEVATVRVSYIDEINGGAERSLAGTATIQFTDDEKQAANSVRSTVAAQIELMHAAVAKDEALVDADAGRYQQAAAKLSRQASVLDQQYQNAPAEMRPQLRQEAENLKMRCNQLQQNQYDSSTRKSLQNESWTFRNSK